jgi:hypothetical protein
MKYRVLIAAFSSLRKLLFAGAFGGRGRRQHYIVVRDAGALVVG